MKKSTRLMDSNPQWTKTDFARALPASEVLSKKAADSLVRKGGRPPKPAETRKQQVTMRFAPDLLAEMRATGPGWQVRAEEILAREFLPVKSPGVKGPMISMRDMMKGNRVLKTPSAALGRNAAAGRLAGRGKARSEGGKKRA